MTQRDFVFRPFVFLVFAVALFPSGAAAQSARRSAAARGARPAVPGEQPRPEREGGRPPGAGHPDGRQRLAGGPAGAPSRDVILGANGQELESTEALGREVLRAIERGGILLAVQRGRFVYNLELPL